MAYTTVLLHANMLYAEFPFESIPQVVERSYLPVLRSILKNPKIKVTLNFSGSSLELLNGEHQEIYQGKNRPRW